MQGEKAFSEDLRTLIDCDEYTWRGLYDDARLDRHVRSYGRKLVKMSKANDGFGNWGAINKVRLGDPQLDVQVIFRLPEARHSFTSDFSQIRGIEQRLSSDTFGPR